MSVKQADIDSAVLFLKGAMYTLAYELTIEAKYGGKSCCCWSQLKLLWMWKNVLACQVAGSAGNSLSDTKIKLLIHKVNSLCKK